MDWLIFYAVIAFICTAAGTAIGHEKRQASTGFVLGLVFGPVGLIVMAVLPKRYYYTCPHCGGGIEKGFSRCRHCGGEVTFED